MRVINGGVLVVVVVVVEVDVVVVPDPCWADPSASPGFDYPGYLKPVENVKLL